MTSSRYHQISAAALVVFLCSPAFSMHISKNESLHAWSSDGAAALLQVRSHGPEGGGSTAWRVIGASSDETFVVSSDFSPGGPTHPQKISQAQCEKTLAALQQQLDALHFDRVDTRPRGCKERGRDLTLRTLKAHSENANDSFSRAAPVIFGLRGESDVRTAVGAKLVLQFNDTELVAWFVKRDDVWHNGRASE